MTSTASRYEPWRILNREYALQRSRGKCEGLCDRWFSRPRMLQVHHSFGRRNIVCPVLAHHHTLQVPLCGEEHELIHHADGQRLQAHVRAAAITRVLATWPGAMVDQLPEEHVGAMRWIEAALRANGTIDRLEQLARQVLEAQEQALARPRTAVRE